MEMDEIMRRGYESRGPASRDDKISLEEISAHSNGDLNRVRSQPMDAAPDEPDAHVSWSVIMAVFVSSG